MLHFSRMQNEQTTRKDIRSVSIELSCSPRCTNKIRLCKLMYPSNENGPSRLPLQILEFPINRIENLF